MWNRQELKQKGKEAFKRNYWNCVVVSLILTLITGASGGSSSSASTDGTSPEDMADLIISTAESTGISIQAILVTLFSAFAIAFVLILLWNIFLICPLSISIDRFFYLNTKENAKLSELLYAFKDRRYIKSVKVSFLLNLYIALWSLLLIIPGIIKLYEYRMVGYIIADTPELTASECIQKSREMMKGQKWNAFVLDLSFILWFAVTAVTCGIAGVFYVMPYINATNAELYVALKK